MEVTNLTSTCPKCGSIDITYSCEPECCFNHVCGNCLASFQLVTRAIGRKREGTKLKAPEKDSCDPTAACAVCGSLAVWRVSEGSTPSEAVVACLKCGSILELAVE